MLLELPIRDPILQFTLLITAALVVQLGLRRLGLPGLLGLLLVGMLAGPGGLGVVPREPVVELLGEIGLIFVMFIAGFEIDLRVVSRHRRETIVFGLLASGFTGVPAAIAGLLIGFSLPASVLLGALVSSHTLLAYPILLRLGLLDRLSVMTAISGTLLTDTLALVALAVLITPPLGEGLPFGWLLPFVLLGLLVVGSLWAVPRIARYLFTRSWASRVDKALFAMVVLMLLAAATQLIGTGEAILGAFLAGVSLNRALAAREVLREHLEFMGRTLLIPFFFVWTGTLLELEVLVDWPGVWGLAALLLVLVVAGKVAASWITGALYGYPRLDRWLMVGLTIPQAAATLAITVTAREAGIFGDEVVDAVIIVIMLTCLAGSILADRVGRRIRSTSEPGAVSEEAGAPDWPR